MEKTQADAAAQAILEPHLHAQEARSEEIRARRAAEDALIARKRRVAWFVLAGSGIGAVIAPFSGFHFPLGSFGADSQAPLLAGSSRVVRPNNSFKPKPLRGSA